MTTEPRYRVALEDKPADGCSWPVGQDGDDRLSADMPETDGPQLFCGCRVVEGSSYCKAHAARSRGQWTSRKPLKDDVRTMPFDFQRRVLGLFAK